MTTDFMVPSKRPRAPSFSEMHRESPTAAVSDLLPDQKLDMAHQHVQLCNFLDLCRFCKKSLCHNQDVFMYGYLGAFCSKECRAKQMACDIFIEFPRRKANLTKTKGRRTSNDEALDRTTASSSSSSRFYI